MKIQSGILACSVLALLQSTSAMAAVQPGINCTAPVFSNASPAERTGVTFTMSCTNDTETTFSSFVLSNETLNAIESAVLAYDIAWPHTSADIQPGDTGEVNGVAYFPVNGSYEIDFSATYGGETFTGLFCENGANPSACVNVTTTANTEVNNFLYVSSLTFFNVPTVYQCSVDQTDGTLPNPCGDSGFLPGGIITNTGETTFLTLGANTYAYVSTFGDTSFPLTGPVFKCEVDPTTGVFVNDTCSTVAYIPDANIVGVQFNATSSGEIFAYLGDGNAEGNVWKCLVDINTGLLGECSATGPSFANGLLFNTVQEFNGNTYLYTTDGNNGNPGQQVWKCRINPNTGNLQGTCPDSGAGAIFNGPVSIQFQTIGTHTYAYVSSYQEANVYLCNVDKNGNLSDCTAELGYTFGAPQAAIPATINGTNYLYTGDIASNSIVQCTIGSNGTLSACGQVGGYFGGVFGLTFWE